ncbi:P-selectin-like isoform X2 [Hemitrygon akajei]|uniref:P-selectin-like isoform X2 n=1 Tax=Hemitrygon akajei TaxID=2704970 RepID=UPI003BFA3701
MKMVSHASVNCPRIQDKIFRFLTLTVIIYGVLILGGAHSWLYYYKNQLMTWDKARKYCRTHYTDMVAIQNMEEIDYLVNYLASGKGHVWIGLRKRNNIWTWIGTSRKLEDIGMNWALGEPNNGKNNEDCVEMYINVGEKSGLWNDEPCKRKKRPVCYNASCTPDICNGHGECVETIGSSKCACYEGFHGVQCEKVLKCLELETHDHGIMNCSNPYGRFSYNSTCDFSCAEGFSIQGDKEKRLRCNASADWDAPVPKCEANRCRGVEVPSKDIMNCSYPFGKFRYNSICTFGCREGYVVHGAERIQCLASGQWTDQPPRCKVQQCETLVNPEHGTMNCTDPINDFGYNSTCDFSCSKGFSLNGLSRLQCKISGQWSAQTPTCEAVKCSELKVLPNLSMNCSDHFGRFSYGSVCDFLCEDGFTLQGSDRLECEVSGQWTSKVPICKAIQCTPLKIPERGNMNCKDIYGDFSYNSTCVFSCIEGFAINGSNNLQCEASSQWTAEVPTCEVVKCTALENPEQGSVSCSHLLGPFSYNATCDFKCERGFVLNGSETIQCGAFGQWTPQIPSCEAMKCDMLRNPDRGSHNCTHPIDYYSYNSSCDFSCAEGFMLVGSHRLECRDSGQWTAETPTCRAVSCQTVTQPERGMVNCTHPIGHFSYSSTCSFDCTEGFVLQGSEMLVCEANGQWTAPVPNCKAVTCQSLTDPEQGTMNCSHPIGDFSYSSMCDFSCVEGFALKGSKSLQCQSNGQWTAQNPNCEVLICERLMQPEQGAMNCSHPIGSFSFNSTCDFSCAEGFILNGSDHLQCEANGQWTAQSPKCTAVKCDMLRNPDRGTYNCTHPVDHFGYRSWCDFSCAEGFTLMGSHTLECRASGHWTAEAPTCRAVSCQTVTQPERGMVNCTHPIGHFSYSSTCSFDCTEGFVLQGSEMLVCEANGQWTAPVPNCKAVSCQTVTQPERGMVNCTHPIGHFSYSSTCSFDCTEGFVLQGSEMLVCEANGQWTAPVPNCKAVTCQTLTDPEQGTMNCSHPIGDFSYSSMCDFSCVEGFALKGSKSLQCQSNGQWTAQNPNCEVLICERLMQPEHGAMNCFHSTGSFSFNSACDFSCAEGFTLVGSHRLECRASGQWTAEKPTCRAVKCDALNTPDRGSMKCTHPFGKFRYSSKCEVSCLEGFALKGAAEIECTGSGNWTNMLPFCKAMQPPLGSDFLLYVGGIAAVAVLGLVIAMIMIWIRRKMKSQASDDSQMLTSESAEVKQDTFENPTFMNNT